MTDRFDVRSHGAFLPTCATTRHTSLPCTATRDGCPVVLSCQATLSDKHDSGLDTVIPHRDLINCSQIPHTERFCYTTSAVRSRCLTALPWLSITWSVLRARLLGGNRRVARRISAGGR